MLWKCCTQSASKFGKLSSSRRTGKVFIPIPKKGNVKECSNYCRIALISHTSKFSLVQSLSRVQLFATPWSAEQQASLSINNSWSPPKPMCIELVMPSNNLILCHPSLLLPSIFPSIGVFSNESAFCIRWPKYWSFSFNISHSNEHPGLILRMDWLDLLAVRLQVTLKRLLQHHIKRHQFFCIQLSLYSNSHIHTWPLEKP